jgi:hypothetical protein
MTHDEEVAALCKALNKAHELLAFIVRHDGKTTPQFVQSCRDWVEGEYSPDTSVTPCNHLWKKAAIDNSVHCILCGVHGGEAH